MLVHWYFVLYHKEIMNCFLVGIVCGLTCFLSACVSQQNFPPNSRPNVILFLADDLGYNDLSCYRNSRPIEGDRQPTCQTPNIDLLAAQGMRFTDFYAGAAVCSPSRSALLTGRNATRVGIYNWIPTNSPMHLRHDEVTMAEMLKGVDYQTAHIGKWHLTSEGTKQPLPMDQGFDHSFYAYNNANPSHKNPDNYYRNGSPMGKMEGYACQIVVDEAITWLRGRNKKDPFFLNVWFNEPHLKVEAPDELKARHTYNQEYYGSIENMDLAVGRLLKHIEDQGLENETIVIFTSDNGSRWDQSNDPLRGEKCFNFEGGIRTPFIIKWPGNVQGGEISEAIGSFTDVLPSIAEITNAPLPQKVLDGESLIEVFKGEVNDFQRKTPLFFYRYFHDPICVIRENDWVLLGYQSPIPLAESLDEYEWSLIKPPSDQHKYSQWSFQENHMQFIKLQEPVHFELYNLKYDLGQENDLSQKESDRTKRMKAEMKKLKSEMINEGGDWFELKDVKK